MPYISQTVTEPDEPLVQFIFDKPTQKAINDALQEGKDVAIQSSTFTDRGADWNEVLINGEVLEGSRVLGH